MGIRVFNFLIDFEKADNRHKQTTGGWVSGELELEMRILVWHDIPLIKSFFHLKIREKEEAFNYEKKKKSYPSLFPNKKYHTPISNPITTLSALLFDFTQKFLYIVFEK